MVLVTDADPNGIDDAKKQSVNQSTDQVIRQTRKQATGKQTINQSIYLSFRAAPRTLM